MEPRETFLTAKPSTGWLIANFDGTAPRAEYQNMVFLRVISFSIPFSTQFRQRARFDSQPRRFINRL